ncbi:hypothetical protein HYPSUDRAFT_882274 [Hypholoma sublateritium FD-334 SS-4]|uniref:Uncharacterized protein n=1 Tax=Hypholoma sublateritium (strain FD-334 SS-4) TaxID=945553 RepID=A0A0D2LJJ5_HYPSF|nr:hypothetical protein HYPSUDRAFT_882274 [Hypholoma sublateritium FD-334 SS-4]
MTDPAEISFERDDCPARDLSRRIAAHLYPSAPYHRSDLAPAVVSYFGLRSALQHIHLSTNPARSFDHAISYLSSWHPIALNLLSLYTSIFLAICTTIRSFIFLLMSQNRTGLWQTAQVFTILS